MGYAGDERVTHAESSMAVGHTSIRPALGESLKLIELVGNKATETAIGTFDDVLEAARSRATFSREDGAARLVEASGKLMAPSEYVYVKPVILLVRSSRLLPLR